MVPWNGRVLEMKYSVACSLISQKIDRHEIYVEQIRRHVVQVPITFQLTKPNKSGIVGYFEWLCP